MYLHNHLLRHRHPAEEAAANFKVPGIVGTSVAKIRHAGLADTVSAIEAILRSSAQTGEAGAIAQDIPPLVFKTLEVVAMYLRRGSPSALDRLPEVIHKVIFDQVDKAAS
jgi:hypothetical protein